MLDEWKGEDGIQVLDGWSFQASYPLFLIWSTADDPASTLVFVRVCLFENDQADALTDFYSRSRVYFKSPEMHGKTCEEVFVLRSFYNFIS